MPEFEKKYKKTPHELHDEELIAKDGFFAELVARQRIDVPAETAAK